MAFAMLHSFNDKQIFKISYTNSAVGTYESRSREEWEKKFDNWTREWAIEFPTAELAKQFKMARAKGMKRTRGLGLSNDYLAEYVTPEGHEELSKTYVSCVYSTEVIYSKKHDNASCGLFNFILSSEKPENRVLWTRVFIEPKEARKFLKHIEELYEDKAVKIGDITIYIDSKRPNQDDIVQTLIDLEKKKDKQSQPEDDPEAYARDYGESDGW